MQIFEFSDRLLDEAKVIDKIIAAEKEAKKKAKRDIPQGSILLQNARIISMNGDEVIEHGDILVINNRIKEIGKTGSLELPTNTKKIDMTGKSIVPGFVDTHSHMWPEWGLHRNKSWIYMANLAYGVMTTRDPQTATTDVFTYADMVRSGQMLGPRIYSTGPGIFWSEPISSLKQAKKVLQRYSKYYKTDTIKMYIAGNRQTRQWLIQAVKEQKIMPTTKVPWISN